MSFSFCLGHTEQAESTSAQTTRRFSSIDPENFQVPAQDDIDHLRNLQARSARRQNGVGSLRTSCRNGKRRGSPLVRRRPCPCTQQPGLASSGCGVSLKHCVHPRIASLQAVPSLCETETRVEASPTPPPSGARRSVALENPSHGPKSSCLVPDANCSTFNAKAMPPRTPACAYADP